MATWYEIQRKNREAARRLRERGIPDQPPLFFGSGRGRGFGRKPYDYYRPAPKRADTPATSDPPTGTDAND
jgi:hypothetical protein